MIHDSNTAHEHSFSATFLPIMGHIFSTKFALNWLERLTKIFKGLCKSVQGASTAQERLRCPVPATLAAGDQPRPCLRRLMSFMSSHDASCRLMTSAALAQLNEDVETASGGLDRVSVDTQSGECTVHPAHWSGRLLVRVRLSA